MDKTEIMQETSNAQGPTAETEQDEQPVEAILQKSMF